MGQTDRRITRLTGYGLLLVRRHGKYSRPDFARHLRRKREVHGWGQSVASRSGITNLEHLDEVPTRYVVELRELMGPDAFAAAVRHVKQFSPTSIIEEDEHE